MYHRFISFLCADLIPNTVCKSWWCQQTFSRLGADLRENPTKQWASRDVLIQSAGSISNNAHYRSNANIALGPILKMYIPGPMHIFNTLNSDGYSTGNAPPSGNNVWYQIWYMFYIFTSLFHNFVISWLGNVSDNCFIAWKPCNISSEINT